MEKEWITTSELLAFLKSHPDDEFTCQLYLGYRLYPLLVLGLARAYVHAHSRLAVFACQRERDS